MYRCKHKINAAFVEFLSDEINIPSNGFRADYLRTRYEALLWRYTIEMAKSDYVNNKDDHLKLKGRFTPPHQDDLVLVE
uniref:Ulp1 protease family, C-terminal catalytic domain containing protein n=1 Tax=Solanum tuberosum TaxID=4113 RepID=M0ZHB6_SOLTU